MAQTKMRSAQTSGLQAADALVMREDLVPRTYAANTWYTIGGTIGIIDMVQVWAALVNVQYSNVSYHTYAGGDIVTSIYWKNSGTQLDRQFVMVQHNGDDIFGKIRFSLATGGLGSIQVSFSAALPVGTGGFVRVNLRRLL